MPRLTLSLTFSISSVRQAALCEGQDITAQRAQWEIRAEAIILVLPSPEVGREGGGYCFVNIQTEERNIGKGI